MRVLVAGSRGYCGKGIVWALRQRGWQGVGVDLSDPDSEETGSGWHEIQADILDAEFLLKAMAGCQAVIDAVIYRPGDVRAGSGRKIHLPAGRGQFDLTNTLMFQVNVSGTLSLLEAARQAQVQQVVLLSSARVVWDHFVGPDGKELSPEPGFRVDSGTPLKFSDQYGLSKYLQERLGAFYASEFGLSVTILRPWWVVDGEAGCNRYGQPLLQDTIPLSPAGMVDRVDLGEACCLALLHPEFICEIFYPTAGPGCERYFDVQPLIEKLGWQPKHTFPHLVKTYGPT